jgi:hypothetical protein
LPNRNLHNGRSNVSEPHSFLLVSRGAICNHCDFRSKSAKLARRHLTQNYVNSDRDSHWLRNGVGSTASMQSWTRNRSRAYRTVDARSRATFRTFDSLTMHSPRRMKRLETLREAERERVEQDSKIHDISGYSILVGRSRRWNIECASILSNSDITSL